ncbi:MAG: ABC transporter [Legionellales bacterium RIFCSPHIGHO2_12_FULL_37_14]|nr:MAG: ABC transporter [Legionellales bacterium RIFCSPHIGHO2_12_FULL_37_14]
MYALSIQNLTKTYKNGLRALKGLNLDINTGDFFALLGANGAGKSTTIGLITTLLNKTSGQIKINGYDLDINPQQAKSFMGVVPQEVNLNIFETCEQILLNQAGYYGIPRKEAYPKMLALLDQLGLSDKRKQIARLLSGGMKRRLMIARALIHNPAILILDEPTAGVDIEIRRSMWDFLTHTNKQGTTIILTTHYLEEAEQLCKNVGILHQGVLIENTSIQQLLATLQTQTFVLNTLSPFAYLPDLTPFKAHSIDLYTFELEVKQNVTLNEMFSVLSKHNIAIQSMRTKTNRLEALFLDRIQNEP